MKMPFKKGSKSEASKPTSGKKMDYPPKKK
jgi:hypothetical protein